MRTPLVPVLLIAASVVVVFMQLIALPKDSLAGLGMVAAGLPIYFLWSSRTRGVPQ